MFPSQEYRPEPQDGFSSNDYQLYMFMVEQLATMQMDNRPEEGDYEDPHFQAFLNKMEDRERLLEDAPW